MGHMRVRLGQHDEAIAAFQNLAALVPQEVEHSTLRARALKFQAEVQENKQPPSHFLANARLGDALNTMPEHDPLLDHAELHELQGRVRKQMLPRQRMLVAARTKLYRCGSTISAYRG